MAVPVESTSPAADDVQVSLLRKAGTAGRFARARSLTSSVIALARLAIRRRHPEWCERDVLLEFVSLHYGRELGERVRCDLQRRGR
jgi:hypothetical protein